MTPLNKEQRQNIIEIVNFMQVELADLEQKYANTSWETYSKDRDIRRNIERLIENLANSSIDICKIILAGETVEIPGTYQQIILKLGEQKILNHKLAAKVAELARARNVLAHQYMDYKWDLIKPLLKESPVFLKEFIKDLKI